VGTTKLTRKEILHEDPVHEVLVWVIEFFRANGAKAVAGVIAVAVLIFGIYSGMQYLDTRESLAQDRLGKAMDYFSASIDPRATGDPFGNGPNAVFRNDTEKYRAVVKELSPIASGFGYGQVSVIARYYVGLSQVRLGEKKEAAENLKSVASNSKNRTLGFLAKEALAIDESNSGNYKAAQQLLEGIIKDPQCDLQKDELNIQLSRVLVAEGKRDEAIKVLLDASTQNAELGPFKQQLMAELEKLQKASPAGTEPEQVLP
jgi:tetratricopeptide (TPR) repeat protein